MVHVRGDECAFERWREREREGEVERERESVCVCSGTDGGGNATSHTQGEHVLPYQVGRHSLSFWSTNYTKVRIGRERCKRARYRECVCAV